MWSARREYAYINGNFAIVSYFSKLGGHELKKLNYNTTSNNLKIHREDMHAKKFGYNHLNSFVVIDDF